MSKLQLLGGSIPHQIVMWQLSDLVSHPSKQLACKTEGGLSGDLDIICIIYQLSADVYGC